MSFDPVWWALARKKAGCSGGSGGGGNTPSGGDNFPIGDGNTHIWISLAEGRTSPMLGVGVNGTVTVDWGDGSAPDTLTGTSTSTIFYTPNHEYGKAGDYIITLSGDGQIGFCGKSSQSKLLVGFTYADNRNMAYVASIQKVEFGNNSQISVDSAFGGCYNLSELILSNGTTDILEGCFRQCNTLQKITISSGVKAISSFAFQACYALGTIKFPSSLTSIASDAFAYDYSMRCYDFSQHTTIPTLSATSAFVGIPSDCEIRVPAALVDEWKAATNWSTYADYIVGV